MAIPFKRTISFASASIAAYFVHHKYQQYTQKVNLDPDNPHYTPLHLISTDQVTPTVYRVRLGLPHEQHPNLFNIVDPNDQNTVYHLNIKENFSQSYRPFTPFPGEDSGGLTTDSNIIPATQQYIDLFIKQYPYPKGEVARYIKGTLPGEVVEVHGPHKTFTYKPETEKKRNIYMIAGGTGVLPMLQLMHIIAKHPHDKSSIHLLFLNRQPNEIFLRNEIERIKERLNGKNKTSVHYIVDKVNSIDGSGEEFKGRVGMLSGGMLESLLPKPKEEDLLFICGPPGLCNYLSNLLPQFGFTSSQTIQFKDSNY